MLCFIPIAYNVIKKYLNSSFIQLEEDAPTTESIDSKPAPKELKGWAPWLFWIPAACDLTGTTLMNVGLLYTPVSIYQMTRGALVLWVGLFSVMFLRRHLWLYQWLSLLTVMAGVSLVGLSGSLAKNDAPNSSEGIHQLLARMMSSEGTSEPATVFVGILFVLFAQIFTATQFVVEEKIMHVYSVHPLLAVGYEGAFGFFTILLAFPILTKYKSYSTFFDLAAGWDQIIHNETVLYTSIAIAISIGLFNAFGLV
ncbi:uncharacterized protein EI90DRAFT_53336 [Cantharellus anzutake]|uniref:uncharacterized protein n=1 Tax=Cantharellus anzutake TaxID=1750568 RepID=UPI0019081CD7|nr:uncharacterized protein EI90DRAFT_53336 [Cantharellus anzutake]KAF8344168.1 hypothetical protein EI90DRAFT_53336 [Cantharellus anzutake]